jgi:hypothetical protein
MKKIIMRYAVAIAQTALRISNAHNQQLQF